MLNSIRNVNFIKCENSQRLLPLFVFYFWSNYDGPRTKSLWYISCLEQHPQFHYPAYLEIPCLIGNCNRANYHVIVISIVYKIQSRKSNQSCRIYPLSLTDSHEIRREEASLLFSGICLWPSHQWQWGHIATSQSFAPLDQFSVEKPSKLTNKGIIQAFVQRL